MKTQTKTGLMSAGIVGTLAMVGVIGFLALSGSDSGGSGGSSPFSTLTPEQEAVKAYVTDWTDLHGSHPVDLEFSRWFPPRRLNDTERYLLGVSQWADIAVIIRVQYLYNSGPLRGRIKEDMVFSVVNGNVIKSRANKADGLTLDERP